MAFLASKDASLLAFAKKLKDVEEVLDNLVDDYSDLSCAKRVKLDDGSNVATISSQLNLSDVLSYARRISYTTFAPPEFEAGQAPLHRSLPPAPQEEQMRASQLYNFANIDVGLPKTVMEPPLLVPTEAYQAPNLGALQGQLPPHFTMSSGWRPGMPVESPEGPLPQEPIQVRPVQLDILDDQDYDSSDEGSSEDED
ncbi:PREDICTED: mediator of RNA polymerase II transcription subunit 4-like [Fragaria vesca subsp. vesca]|uniref:mediator of RNA polymerase II transcription subunit 4-like n=1 Tax=Fragaria vesca subsp. vesca TaxID=101020 RepID=UPI0002C2E978|nr:PREDICTED: mediator of RNA polymerase II transcription subunit 4-like [Fragaria vesca subsp. vesca]